MKKTALALLLSSFFSGCLYATSDIEHIEVSAQKSQLDSWQSVEGLLSTQGVNFSAAGGVSALPVMQGLMGDRIKILIDGATTTAACANQMNPPLSYLSANQIRSATVIAGIAPVSLSGDSIAGVISIDTMQANYANSHALSWQNGYVSVFHRGNNDQNTVNAHLSLSSNQLSVAYTGSYDRANSYEDGNGERVSSTLFSAQNHALVVGVQQDDYEWVTKLTYQAIPYQGFANQYMDMTDNTSFGINSRYTQALNDGQLLLRGSWQRVQHEMGFFSDEKTGMMPMNTDASELSLVASWSGALSQAQSLNIGTEYHLYQLDDWWPPVAGHMMMGPNEFININNGQRQRIALFAESEWTPSSQWLVSGGVRIEHVTTDADEVQPYNTMPMMGMPNPDAMAANVFNQSDRLQRDTLLDISLMAAYTLSANSSLEFGIARNNRAPNLYERYSWGRGVMASTMIGWFGDGNGYVGNINLSPETATQASVAYHYKSDDERVEFSLSPFYKQIDDFIDVNVINTFSRPALNGARPERNQLQFSNIDATLYGLEVNARYVLSQTQHNRWHAQLDASMNRGTRDTDNSPLYQIMPWQASVGVFHTSNSWQSALNIVWVDDKHRVDPLRLENSTESYSLVNISTQYTIDALTLSAGITNLFDRDYALPLGGVSVSDVRMNRADSFAQLSGEGRSFNIGMRYQF